MKKNILNLYEGFFDDLDQLNKDDEFGDVNGHIYDEHNFILGPDKNPEFFYGLCKMCKDKGFQYNKKGFTQEDLNQIENIYCYDSGDTYFKDVTSLDELQYFNNLENIFSFSFCNCIRLKSVIFPKNLKKINTGGFYHCESLKEIILPENFIEIQDEGFGYCYSLEKIVFNENIRYIPKNNSLCTNNNNLKEIVIPLRFKNSIEDIFDSINLINVNITYI